jgi:predicted Ser/Thr protein kinase
MFISRGLPATFNNYFSVFLDALSLIVFAGMALFLYWQKRDDWMALYIGTMLILTCAVYTSKYSGGIFLWIDVALIALGETSQVVFFYIFPSGKFIPRIARWLPLPLFIFRFLIWANIYINDVDQGAIEVGIVVLLMLIGMGHQAYRYNRLSTPVQRQQTKFVLLGLCITIPVVAGYIYVINIAHLLGPEFTPDNYFLHRVLRVIEQFALYIFPLSLIFSILRYRLWDIDVVINKSLVIVAMTIMLAIPFGIAFWITHRLILIGLGEAHTEIAVAASGIAAGALFNPVHRRARNFIDRRLYGLRFNLNELQKGQSSPSVQNPGYLTGRKFGEYEVLDVIGHGGMGEVYKGFGNNRVVAIKVLPQKFSGQSDFKLRFVREAKTTTALEHPNIVKMYDYGETEDGIAYMIMQFIEGEELSAIIKRKEKISPKNLQSFAEEIAQALDYAHQRGFVHRDIKPSNIMVRQDESGKLHPILMDFGVAKIQDAHTHLTGTGVVGTIDYMAPEQIQEAGAVDGRADIYALGLVFYESLTGERAFKGSPAQIMFSHIQQPAPDPRNINPEIPQKISEAILKTLAKQPNDRFATASAFASAMA